MWPDRFISHGCLSGAFVAMLPARWCQPFPAQVSWAGKCLEVPHLVSPSQEEWAGNSLTRSSWEEGKQLNVGVPTFSFCPRMMEPLKKAACISGWACAEDGALAPRVSPRGDAAPEVRSVQ